MRRLFGFLGGVLLGVLLIGPVSTVFAQIMQLQDGTTATKVAVFYLDGTAATFSGAGGTLSGYAEDTPAQSGDTLVPSGFVRKNSVAADCADGDRCIGAIDANGRLYTQAVLYTSLGVEVTIPTDATHDSAALATGSQSMLAHRADLSGTAGVTDGDAVRGLADNLGRMLRGSPCPGGNIVDGQAAITDGSSTSVIAAGGASIVNEVWELTINNSSATQVTVDIRDGTAGAVLGTYPAPAGGGVAMVLAVPIRSTANTALAADPSASASTVTVSLRGCLTR